MIVTRKTKYRQVARHSNRMRAAMRKREKHQNGRHDRWMLAIS